MSTKRYEVEVVTKLEIFAESEDEAIEFAQVLANTDNAIGRQHINILSEETLSEKELLALSLDAHDFEALLEEDSN